MSDQPPDDKPALGPRLGIVADASQMDFAMIAQYAGVFRAAIVASIEHGPRTESLVCHALVDVCAEIFAGAPREVKPMFINALMEFFETRIGYYERELAKKAPIIIAPGTETKQ